MSEEKKWPPQKLNLVAPPAPPREMPEALWLLTKETEYEHTAYVPAALLAAKDAEIERLQTECRILSARCEDLKGDKRWQPSDLEAKYAALEKELALERRRVDEGNKLIFEGEAKLKEAEASMERVAPWLSAALEDKASCEQFKADIYGLLNALARLRGEK